MAELERWGLLYLLIFTSLAGFVYDIVVEPMTGDTMDAVLSLEESAFAHLETMELGSSLMLI